MRNYNEVLKDCKDGDPVFITKNGRGKYVQINVEEYDRQKTIIKLLSKLNEAEEAVVTGEEWKSLDELKRDLEV